MPDIQLLDGKKITFDKAINGFDLVKKISKSLEKKALIMKVDGDLKDLSYEIKENSTVQIITSDDQDGLDVLRHDAAHIMAMSVIIQFLLGLTTLLLGVPVWAGALHQAGAVLLLIMVLIVTHRLQAQL